MTTTEVRERPIIFSTEMVKAILEGRKTQTRRVVKPQLEDYRDGYPDGRDCPPTSVVKQRGHWIDEGDFLHDYCPYGKVGDLLWVRETHNIGGIPPNEWAIYKADEYSEPVVWRPSIHMPKWATRIWLEITGVRVERLQDISHQEVIAEGVTPLPFGDTRRYMSGVPVGIQNFRFLWDSLNAKRGYGWNVNPWVWVIEFSCQKDA